MNRLFVRFVEGYTLSPHTLARHIPLPPRMYRHETILVLGGSVWPQKMVFMPLFMEYFQKGFGHIIMEEHHASLLNVQDGVHTVNRESSILFSSPCAMIHHHSVCHDGKDNQNVVMDKMSAHPEVKHIILSNSKTPVPLLWSYKNIRLPSFLWLCAGEHAVCYQTSPFHKGFHAIWCNHTSAPNYHGRFVFELNSGSIAVPKYQLSSPHSPFQEKKT